MLGFVLFALCCGCLGGGPCLWLSFSRFRLCRFGVLGVVRLSGIEFWKLRIHCEGKNLECELKCFEVFNLGNAGICLLACGFQQLMLRTLEPTCAL